MIVWKLDALMRQRRAKGRQMAKRMGIGENYLSRVRHEVPDRLSLELLDGLCRELECTIADLLEYRPSAAAPQVAIAELHQEVMPVRRRTRRAPAPAPVAAPSPVPEPMPEPAPVVQAPAPVATPTPVAPPAPPRERPVLPLMAPLPGSPAPAAPQAVPAPTPTPVPVAQPIPSPVTAAVPVPATPEPAPPAPTAKEAEVDTSASDAAAHYVRLDALQAKLDRLKRRR